MSDWSDEISDYLEDGWTVAGFTTAMAAAGALIHSVLLQKGANLVVVTVVRNNNKEVGRAVGVLAPKPH